MLNEVWKDVKGFEDSYKVSSYGRIKSLTKNWKEDKFLSDRKTKKGYLHVYLMKGSIAKNIPIHNLVWDHFGNKKRNGMKLQVDHIDGNKLNNHISNLQLLTNRENTSKYHKRRGVKKYVGVHKVESGNFIAKIYVDGKYLHLGTFGNQEAARKAYLKKLEEIQ